MMSFECDQHKVMIAIDAAGVSQLVDLLKQLEKRGGHLHLLTPANGGHELEERTPWGGDAIGEVIIDLIEF